MTQPELSTLKLLLTCVLVSALRASEERGRIFRDSTTRGDLSGDEVVGLSAGITLVGFKTQGQFGSTKVSTFWKSMYGLAFFRMNPDDNKELCFGKTC